MLAWSNLRQVDVVRDLAGSGGFSMGLTHSGLRWAVYMVKDG